jgi:hypothetical protein
MKLLVERHVKSCLNSNNFIPTILVQGGHVSELKDGRDATPCRLNKGAELVEGYGRAQTADHIARAK